LKFEEIVEGLKHLSEVKGQEEHDWNTHEWVAVVFKYLKDNMKRMKRKELMFYYFMLKKLKYSDEEFWKKMYARIEENIYEISNKNFSYLYLTYYDKFESVFSP
jgi:hypothetical protein